MGKTVKIFFVVCMACLTTACKATTSETEETKKTYKELLESIDMESDRLDIQLTDNLNIHADIIPKSSYENGLGVYEFQRETLSFSSEEFAKRLNKYYGKEQIVSSTQKGSALMDNEAHCSSGPSGSTATYFYNKEAQSYIDFAVTLFGTKYPIYIKQPDEILAQADTIRQKVFYDQFPNMNEKCFQYIILAGEEDYNKLEKQYRNIHIGLKENDEDRLFTMDMWVGGTISEQKRSVYGAQCYEIVGNTNLFLKPINRASYKNTENRQIPETSYKSMGSEVITPIDNKLLIVFDDSGQLQAIYTAKYIRVNDTPEKTEQIIDLKKVIDILYEKMKNVKKPVNIYSIDLYYTGVIAEEGEGLEDYISPVWEIYYYDSSSKSRASIVLDAITGKEIPNG